MPAAATSNQTWSAVARVVVVPKHSQVSPRRRCGITRDTVDAWARDLVDLGDRSFFSLNRYVFVGVR
jgi:hypothetical protein